MLEIILVQGFCPLKTKITQFPNGFCLTALFTNMRLCIKVGRGHGNACVGTWDLGTRDEGLEDIKYGTRGRVGRGRGDFKHRDAGTIMIIEKVGGKFYARTHGKITRQ